MYKPVEKKDFGVKEIARLANVSIATVDRVLHNRKGVSEATKKKINDIIKEFDYKPNVIASRLASKKTSNFVVLIPRSTETDFWEAPMLGVDRALKELKQYGIRVTSYFFDLNDKKSFVKQVELMMQQPIDGILMAPSFIDEALELIDICRERKIPYVFINSDIPRQNSVCYIGPHLFCSGYQAAQLMDFAVKKGKLLVVNVSKEIDQYHHLVRKEEGFRAYFEKNNRSLEIVKIDVKKTDRVSVEEALDHAFNQHKEIEGVFVTNSRVSSVAHYFEVNGINKLLIGYDFLRENIKYLELDIIDFLICQKPEEQGYRGIMTLYRYIVLNERDIKDRFMPIDIVTKENYRFYHN
ncbi:substrate-binding domain-containing protein [Olivibacter sp. SDN3]|uniref:LacI family DNA-binding transcriptional regulator n=1 Tax=Olivibacter sp. SDN3 TaxID=2764720 RepID=UPI00165168C2|nr:substrate-binding domain-containing protein [Olivibacter sp. SDN3]QNL49298.1 substrate-binding domain-containing protein [Olivibacter sp. SDN3]